MSQRHWMKSSSTPLHIGKIGKMSEDQAWMEFVKMRWGEDGTQECPRCKTVRSHYFKKTRKQWTCKSCKFTFSVTSGTKLANRKLPFSDILIGMLLFVAGQKGDPALEMRRLIQHTYRSNFILAGRFREAMQETQDETPMTGQVQIDGIHLSGKIRKGRVIKRPKIEPQIPKKYAVKKPEGEEATAQTTGRQHRTKYPSRAGGFMPNRRIGLVFCQVSPNKGEGSTRVRTAVVHRETAPEIEALTKKFVQKGTMIWTDEGPGFGNLKLMGYEHEAVNHSIEFSSLEGVNNNQAESANSRIRRAEIGVYHRITPKYMDLYLSEMAWRENTRRKTTREQFNDLGTRLLCSGKSKIWINHARGPARKDENLFWVGSDPRLSKPVSIYSKPIQTQ